MMTSESFSPHPRLAGAIELLSRLISVPSFSREEDKTADIWEEWLKSNDAGDVTVSYTPLTLPKILRV